jgi:hypothetical protein
MPNWCENTLVVAGEKKQVQEFKKKAKTKDTDLSFQQLIPLPKALGNTDAPPKKKNKTLIKQYGADNWYDWQVNNWGTKWDVEASLNYDDSDMLEYSFLSAWSPPIGFLERVSKLYPALSFRLKYEEGGMGFMGIAVAKEGQVEDKSVNY